MCSSPVTMNPYGLPNVHIRELTVKEHCLHVHVMDLPTVIHRESEHQTNGLHARHRSEDFFKVDVGMLLVHLCDEVSLVLDNYASLMLHHLVNALEVDGTVAIRKSLLLLPWHGLTVVDDVVDVAVTDW
jgi:hypothetical protein